MSKIPYDYFNFDKPISNFLHRFDEEGTVLINPKTHEPIISFKYLNFDEIKEWLEENIRENRWWINREIVPWSGDPNPESTTLYLLVYFYNEIDLMAFKLRWI